LHQNILNFLNKLKMIQQRLKH